MWPDAARRNITQENFHALHRRARARSAHHDLMDSSAGVTKSIWDYLDILVNDKPAAKARKSSPSTRRIRRDRKAYGRDR